MASRIAASPEQARPAAFTFRYSLPATRGSGANIRRMTEPHAAAPGAHGTPPKSFWPRLRGGAGTALMVALVALLMEWVTEASIGSEVARHMAARMFVLYDGYFYSQGAGAAAASDRLLVVDVGKPTLQRWRASWPLAYGQHARLLERLRQARPAALFIDFQFESRRDDPTLPALMDTLCAFRADGIPVFLAAGSEAAEGRLRPELEALRDGQGRPCFEKVAVAHEPSPIDRLSWTYPLRGEAGGEAIPSAALALAEALRGEPLLEPHAHHDTLGLVWGSTDRHGGPAWIETAPDQGHDGEDHAEAATRHYCRAPGWRDLVPLQSFFAHVAGFAPDRRPHCPMQASLQALELTAPKTDEQAQAQAALIRGRAVLYGGSFDPNDFITSPLQAELPGVYLHAQAADNLLRFGRDWRHPEIAAGHGHAAEWGFTGAAMLVLALALAVGRALASALGAALGGALGRLRAAHPVLERRLGAIGGGVRRGGRAVWRRLPGRLQALLARAGSELWALARRLGSFYGSLLLAVPLCLALEHGLHVAVIGYSSVLAFCLFGELFTAHREMAEAVHHHGHHDPSPEGRADATHPDAH